MREAGLIEDAFTPVKVLGNGVWRCGFVADAGISTCGKMRASPGEAQGMACENRWTWEQESGRV